MGMLLVLSFGVRDKENNNLKWLVFQPDWNHISSEKENPFCTLGGVEFCHKQSLLQEFDVKDYCMHLLLYLRLIGVLTSICHNKP